MAIPNIYASYIMMSVHACVQVLEPQGGVQQGAAIAGSQGVKQQQLPPLILKASSDDGAGIGVGAGTAAGLPGVQHQKQQQLPPLIFKASSDDGAGVGVGAGTVAGSQGVQQQQLQPPPSSSSNNNNNSNSNRTSTTNVIDVLRPLMRVQHKLRSVPASASAPADKLLEAVGSAIQALCGFSGTVSEQQQEILAELKQYAVRLDADINANKESMLDAAGNAAQGIMLMCQYAFAA
jgi:outer membrane scaffolding protein for murein synthesis (MipA/OmpV family)